MLLSKDEDGLPSEKVETYNNSTINTNNDEATGTEEPVSTPMHSSVKETSYSLQSDDSKSKEMDQDSNKLSPINSQNNVNSGFLKITSDNANLSSNTSSSLTSKGTLLPWGVHKERPNLPSIGVDTDLRPGEFVMRTLFIEFTVQAEKKMEIVMNECLEKLLSKTLQRGEDPQLDQILCAFGTVAEYCLPSLLRALFDWLHRQMQHSLHVSEQGKRPPPDQRNKSIMYIVSGSGLVAETIERSIEELQAERRDLAVEFLFCLALIEVLKQLPFHPGHEDLVQHIENLAFKRFHYKEGIQSSPNAPNIHIIADLYAEVIGMLAQSRFMSVRKRFTAELKELKSREPSPHTTQSIISLLMGMKFFRVKMVPIEEFEASFQFLQECAQYFLDVKDKDIKHSLAGLFVEILVPVAASVKNEVNVPCLKNFVDMLYSQTLDASTKSKHRMSLFPLVTYLLCVSQKAFFLSNWHCFLAMCLSHLKHKDPKMCRVALESLYRLLWVYMIRIKCESNSATQSRLQSIVNSLFPKGSKGVVPRDTPLNIFVKIIQFIAQERLDFAMREIVFDLLMVGRPIKIILTPERMSIGLRAFLVVADSLQQKEGEPPMPRATGTMPSGNTLRVKKTFLNKVLTDETARSIGMSVYFPYVRRILVDILRALDLHYGRPLSMTNTQNINKEQEINTGDRKPRIDLFRTCVAAIPRLIPDGMSAVELVEMLSRLTMHIDEELRGLAYQSLQTLVVDFPDWRQEVLSGYTQFLARDVQDTSPQLVDNGLRMLLQLVTSWKNNVSAGTSSITVIKQEPALSVIRIVEGLALVMLCQCRVYPRRLAGHILRETKLLLEKLGSHDEIPVIDAMDSYCGIVSEQCLSLLPAAEKLALMSTPQLDLQWFCDRTHSVWSPGCQYEDNSGKGVPNANNNVSLLQDPWGTFIIGFMERDRVPSKCPTAVHYTWPILHARINALYVVIDPIPVSDNRASILRSATAPRKPTNERDVYMHVWKNYLTMAFRVVPPIPSPVVRCASPDLSLSGSVDVTETWSENASLNFLSGQSLSTSLENLHVQSGFHGRFTIPLTYGRKEKQHKRTSSSPDSLSGERSDSKSPGGNASPCILYKLVVPLLKCELSDVRDVAVHAIGHINSEALKDLMEELVGLIREAVDRKQENMRRRRRRDALRLHLGRVLQLISENGTFANSPSVLENGSLHSTYVEYIDGARLCLESEAEKDSLSIQEVKLIFCHFVTKIIKSFALETYPTLLKKDLRKNLFQLFAGWSGQYSRFLGLFSQTVQVNTIDSDEELQYAALQAMCDIACCGPCFAPTALIEEGFFYPWLHGLLSSTSEKIYKLARETVVLLLDMNHDIGPLLDWVIDKCYTGEPRVADGAFLALATIFSTREYPCDHYTAVINVTLMCTGCPRDLVHETALQLLQLLDKRFFGNVNPLPTDGDTSEQPGGTLDVLLSTTYCRSQLYLSRQLSQLHPELTMPMFSEITYRFQTARPEVRQLLPRYLLPWLDNIELVDPNVPPTNPLSYFQHYYSTETKHTGFRREGLGSAEATEMVLNNLFYITAKFSDSHPKEIEELWATLCASWPNNLKVIMRYLIIISGMAPNELLQYAKRVVLYLARARPERLLDEMMTELQTVETLNCLIERTETPPFYRLTSMRKASSSHSDGGPAAPGASDTTGRDLTVEKGTIHTKRHSGEDPAKYGGSKTVRNENFANIDKMPRVPASSPQLRLSDEITSFNIEQDNSHGEDLFGNQRQNSLIHNTTDDKFDVPQPHPLPMPEYGGYFAPLKDYLPDNSQPISGFHRCNVAVMLLCDVVLDGVQIDWSIHVPFMLHIVFLGLDHTRPLVHDHCRQLLLNLLIAVAAHDDHLTVARILLNSRTLRLGLGLPIPLLPVLPHIFTEPDSVFDSYLQGNLSIQPSGNVSIEATNEVTPDPQSQPPVIVTAETDNVNESIVESKTEDLQEGEKPIEPSAAKISMNSPNLGPFSGVAIPQPGPEMQIADVIKSLIYFLANWSPNTPLWNYEDITAKVWSVRSCCQLNTLLQHVLKIFRESLPHAHISERWAQIALQLGLSCSSRHYAGRSLQVFRFIGVAMTGRMVSEILSRLVETVAEQGEDMQGYVTELLLTLEAAVDSLESNFRPLDFMKEIFKSTPNLNNKDSQGHIIPTGKRSPSGCGGCMTNHTRSTSYSVPYCMRKNTSTSTTDSKERNRGCTEAPKACPNICRSRSAQSLKMLSDTATQDDKLTILATLFWLAVSLLESDYEHEFLLGVRLLSRIMHRLPLDRPDARDRVEKLQTQLRWQNFPGVHALLLKGCTHPAIYESVVGLLTDLTPLLELSVIDPAQCHAFPMNVIALLPYMLVHYENANEICIRAAHNIAQVSVEKSKKLENLGTVMTLYSRRNFSKESFQWTKCVVKYLWDTYSHLSMQMLAFLVEVLEKGATSLQLPVLSILHCMLYYVDLNTNSAQPLNADFLRVIAKFIDGGSNFKEAMKILKLVVTRCSTLVVPPHWDTNTTSLSDTELQTKKELPGRTMDFTFDLSQTPVIGRKYLPKGSTGPNSLNSDILHLSSEKTGEKSNAGSGPNSVSGTISNTGMTEESSLAIGQLTNLDKNEKNNTNLQENLLFESPRRSMSLSPADVVNISGWKRPWMSQARVRECLVNLLTACGQRVGLPKSPSVIFSQSSELLERESSMASSLEEVSGAHGDYSGGSRSHDAPPDHFAVFKDFDFLEYESESIEGESTDNFNWGVRRHPLSGEIEVDTVLTSHQSHSSGVGNSLISAEVIPTNLTSDLIPNLNITSTVHLDDPSLLRSPKSEVHILEESSDDEVESESPLYDTYIIPENVAPIRHRAHSLSSGSSGGDLGDVTPCNAVSPGLVPHTLGNAIYRNSHEESWRSTILCSLRSVSFTQPLQLVYQSNSMLKEIINKTVLLCVEGSGYLSPGVGNAFNTVVELLNAEEPPLIWVEPSMIDCPKLLDTIRFAALEMGEHLETFFDRKDHVHERFKSAIGSVVCDEVGRSLYKLVFQLHLLLDTNIKMISAIYQTAISKNAADNSAAIMAIENALTSCVRGAEGCWGSEGGSTPTPSACPSPCPSPSHQASGSSTVYDDTILVQLLNEHRWSSALNLLRERNAVRILEKVELPEDDVSSLLHIYCTALLAKQPNVVMITRPIAYLTEDLEYLLENLFKVSTALKAPHTDRIHSV